MNEETITNEQVDNTHAFICRHERLNRRYRLGSLTFAPDILYTPLQAADILAWELNREFYRQLYPEPEYAYTRNELVALMTRADGDYRHYGAMELRGYFEDVIKKKQGGFILNVPERLSGMTLAEMKAEQEEYKNEKKGRSRK